MGWGAAMAFAEATGFSEHDAYEMLYGDKKPSYRRCPICNHKCKSPQGVSRHMEMTHTKPKHALIVAQWLADNGK